MGAPTATTTAPMNTKTAEFAQLVDLFERLAMRGKHDTTMLSATHDALRPVTVVIPDDLAPVVKGLSNVMGNNIKLEDRSIRARGPVRTPVTCRVVPKRTVPPTNIDDNSDEPDKDAADTKGAYYDDTGAHATEDLLDGFQVGKQYPFTFKLMLHKLYDLDQWAKKVKEVLENSQRQFKPLAEQEELLTPKPGEDKDLLFPRGSPLRRSPVTPMKKQGSSAFMSHSASFGEDWGDSPRLIPSKTGEVHAVKKRLVGRRKSIVDLEKAANGWVYDAKVSAADPKFPTIGLPTFVFTPQASDLDLKEKVERRRIMLSSANREDEVEKKQVKRPLGL